MTNSENIILAMKAFSGFFDETSAIERIDAMRMQEERSARCIVYLTPQVNATCRRLMVDWFFAVADSFALSRETVGSAMSILDRYLSSGNGDKSREALECREMFQTAAIAAFFLAMKIHEPSAFGMRMMLKLCRGIYEENDIIVAENDILSALEWRVLASIPSPMEYVRHFVDLLPKDYVDINGDVILDRAAMFMDVATSDVYFSTCRASHVGMACLARALDDVMPPTSPLDREAIMKELTDKLDWYIVADDDIRKIEKRLRAESSGCESRMTTRATTSRVGLISTAGQPSSPGSVARIMQ
ncbi:hypothetical protein ACHAXA_007992 [Cyclostephanos tholiformis]|uniref:Cyclin-like domain-containing protein n=1 Tax=Cyclostephanos tholiformis TaxID=382380 RepID=A0ABD3R8E2_9STRA